MKNKLVNLLEIIIIGGISGILGVQIFLPWLAGFSFFQKFDWIAQSRNGTTVINRTERVVIEENKALEEAIERTSKIVVGVISQRTEKIVGGKKVALAKPEVLAQGTGFIVSSDGLAVTLENLVPPASPSLGGQTAQKVLVAIGDKNFEAEVKKRDKNSGLALLKISENNLSVLPFLEGDLKLGEKLFLLSIVASANNSLFTDLSIVKRLSPLAVDFSGKDIGGSPIFNIKAELVGVNFVDATGANKILGVSAIKEMLR